MRKFFTRQIRDYYELEGAERVRWILWWLLAIGLIVFFVGLFAWAIVTGEISKENRPSGF